MGSSLQAWQFQFSEQRHQLFRKHQNCSTLFYACMSHLVVCLSVAGFHLSGTVTEPSNPLYSQPEKLYKVSISFDRYILDVLKFKSQSFVRMCACVCVCVCVCVYMLSLIHI